MALTANWIALAAIWIGLSPLKKGPLPYIRRTGLSLALRSLQQRGKLAGELGRQALFFAGTLEEEKHRQSRAEWTAAGASVPEPRGRAWTAAGRMPRSRASTAMRRSMEETSSKTGLRTAPLPPEPVPKEKVASERGHPRLAEAHRRSPEVLGSHSGGLRRRSELLRSWGYTRALQVADVHAQ